MDRITDLSRSEIDDRIATLRQESRQHGDYANAIMCALATETYTASQRDEILTERERAWLVSARTSEIAGDRNLAAHVDGLTAETAWREAYAQLREIERNLAED